MNQISKEQIRQFRLHTHHLDTWYDKSNIEKIAGACGFQNSPPGAWEIALHNRIPDYSQAEMRGLLEEERILLQAWSIRGAPMVFPCLESDTFLSALVSRQDEPWIYTRGIRLALDFLQMSFEELLTLLNEIIGKLEGKTLKSKAELDQTLAEWILPLLPDSKKSLWNSPSMYGNPEKQTVGGAAVSFLLRPCAFMGMVVFGKREGISPTFTSYKSWTGHPLEVEGSPEKKLVRKYLHCFAPGSVSGFADWLGCSPAQARRIWQTASAEMEPVCFMGNERFILTDDKPLFLSPPPIPRKLHLLGGHDPYLGLQDREVILEDRAKQKLIWQTVSNPGAVIWHGEIAGMWSARKKGKGLDVEVKLWGGEDLSRREIEEIIEDYSLFQQTKVNNLVFKI